MTTCFNTTQHPDGARHPHFMAPELFSGAEASVQADLYAVGATLYHLLARKYPYGEIEPFQHPKFGEPVPPARTRPDLPPGWKTSS